MTAISRSKTKIYIVDAGTAASALADTDIIAGEISSYSKSGGERDNESTPVFGGFVDKEKPVSQVEITMEVIPSLENATRWSEMAYSVDGTATSFDVYTMAGELTDKAIYIQGTDGTNYVSYGFNNCNVTMSDIEHNADDNQTGTITFKFSPTNSDGVSNFMTAATAVTSLPAWTGLDNN